MSAAVPPWVWERFVAVLPYEHDSGFRKVIVRLSRTGLRAVGLIGLGCMAFYVGTHLLFLSSTFTLTYTTSPERSVAVWDKLVVVLVSLACLALARTSFGPRWGRLLVAVMIVGIVVGFVLDDVAEGRPLFSAAYLIMLMLVAVGTMPYRPGEMLALCTIMTAGYFIAMARYPALMDADWADTFTQRLIPLTMAVIACTGISALLYRSRFEQYRAFRETQALKEKIIKEKGLRADTAERLADYLQSENERQTQELELARQVQLSMLPRSVPEHPRVEIAAHMETATEVGGDYYDFHVAEDGTLTFVIGDATGHGVQAGTMVTAMKSLWNAFAQEPDLEAVMRKSSEALKLMHLPKVYMALAFGRLKGDTLEFVGGGMPPAVIYRAATGDVEEVSLKGMPSGGPGKYPYRRQKVALAPGDTVVLMSDGFPELRDGSGEMLGYERMAGLVAEAAGRSPEEIIAHFTETIKARCDGHAPDDDVTFIVIRLRFRPKQRGTATG